MLAIAPLVLKRSHYSYRDLRIRTMSQRDGFVGGFFLGAVVGGAVGGVLGAAFATRRLSQVARDDEPLLSPGEGARFDTEESMERARRRLEDKIAQLNLAIDDVRQQLGPTNGNPSEQELP
jgi:hypothetical protein